MDLLVAKTMSLLKKYFLGVPITYRDCTLKVREIHYDNGRWIFFCDWTKLYTSDSLGVTIDILQLRAKNYFNIEAFLAKKINNG
jgi:hypothetical protein